MNRFFCFATTILGLSVPVYGQLTPGDISLIGFSTDEQEFAFVTLTDIAAGQSINFTDAAWDGAAFDNTYASGGTMTWTNGGSLLSTGSVVHIGPGVISGAGSLSGFPEFTSGNKVNEVLFAYTGSAGSPNIILGSIFGRDPSILTSGSVSAAGETYVPATLVKELAFRICPAMTTVHTQEPPSL
ncbi:MAG: hypothetical protein O3C43_19435 [Verrucomicrobia bacterium]|nr:hypothetical protein [Verrucomicrobiota bacterium]MDA1068664.1 hypothetical protein [Verrucomicrobiota bacterium]